MPLENIYNKKSAHAHTAKENINMHEILIYLFENYFGRGGCPDSATLPHKLAINGPGENVINQALNWLSDLTKRDTSLYSTTLAQSDSLRWHAPSETEVIDNEGYGLILFLEQIKFIVLHDLWIQNQLTDPNILEKLFTASNLQHWH